MQTLRSFYRLALIFILAVSASPPERRFSGYMTAHIKGDAVSFRYTGFADRKNQIAYDCLTVQPVGSVSKTFIGLALMIAQDQGLLHLDDDVNRYLDFKVVNPHLTQDQPITFRRLATHTSGILDHPKFYRQSYTPATKMPQTLQEYLQEYFTPGAAKYSRKNFSPHAAGERYEYSNVGAALAAHALEKAVRMPFHQFVRLHILEPLAMHQSGWFIEDIDFSKHAVLYDESGKALSPYSLATYPDGGFRTTLPDLSRYLSFLMKGNQGKAGILSDSGWKEFFRPQFNASQQILNLPEREPNTGIFIIYTRSGAIGHSGSDPGVSAMMWFNPQTLVGKIFMANEDISNKNVAHFQEIWAQIE